MSVREYIGKLRAGGSHNELISNIDFKKYFSKNLSILTEKEAVTKGFNKITNNKNKACIILLEPFEGDVGHWVFVNKTKEAIKEYFDSYGIPCKIFGGKIISNKIPYQALGKNINTCGKHVAFRFLCHKEYGFDLKKYETFMKFLCTYYNATPDEIVSVFVKLDETV